MRRLISFAAIACLIVAAAPVHAAATRKVHAAAGLRLESRTIKAGATITAEQVFHGMGCTGGNISPELHWSGAPAGTKSFAVTLYDPDAPTGSGWWHWVVYNIPAGTTSLAEGAGSSGGNLPEGAEQGRTDFGSPGYGGPCPPQGDKPHHYIFTVFALKTDKIEVPADASPAMVGFNLRANKLASATLTARYGR